jgi:hypothetical protein
MDFRRAYDLTERARVPDMLALYFHGHRQGAAEAERCLGLVEKALLAQPNDALLVGGKAALMLIVQGIEGLGQKVPRLRGKALEMAVSALVRAGPVAGQHIRLMNGLSWTRPDVVPEAQDGGAAQALSFLHVLDHPAMANQLPPMIALEGLVALAVTYERLGQPGPSAARFRAASAIDRMQAIARYEYFRR